MFVGRRRSEQRDGDALRRLPPELLLVAPLALDDLSRTSVPHPKARTRALPVCVSNVTSPISQRSCCATAGIPLGDEELPNEGDVAPAARLSVLSKSTREAPNTFALSRNRLPPFCMMPLI